MKKIVALVLSLVMVLGLATTAFAADTYKLYSADGTSEEPITGDVTFTSAAGKTVVNGVVQGGTVDYYTVNGTKYVVTDEACAEYRLVKNGKVMFVMALDTYDYTAVVKAYDLVKTGCAKEAYAEGVKAVYVKTNLNPTDLPTYYTEDPTGDVYALLGDKVVVLAAAKEKADVVTAGTHTWDATTAVYDSKTGAVASVLCKVCNAKAVAAKSLPVGYEGKAVTGDVLTVLGDKALWYVAGTGSAAADAETDKVESAETFDAGIAMYVGMSVMAAAGSAVVLKKKD